MPIIDIYHPAKPEDTTGVLEHVCLDAAAALGVPDDRVWAMWHELDPEVVRRPDWRPSGSRRGPIVRVLCRRSHPRSNVQALMGSLRTSLGAALDCPESSVFIQVVRVDDEEVLNVER